MFGQITLSNKMAYRRRTFSLTVLLLSMVLAGYGSSMEIKGNKDEGRRLTRLLRDQGWVETATDVYTHLDSRNTLALNGMGVVMDSVGQHTQARQMFEKALQVNPADVSAINNLALSWLASGNPDKAIPLLRSSAMRHPPRQRPGRGRTHDTRCHRPTTAH